MKIHRKYLLGVSSDGSPSFFKDGSKLASSGRQEADQYANKLNCQNYNRYVSHFYPIEVVQTIEDLVAPNDSPESSTKAAKEFPEIFSYEYYQIRDENVLVQTLEENARKYFQKGIKELNVGEAINLSLRLTSEWLEPEEEAYFGYSWVIRDDSDQLSFDLDFWNYFYNREAERVKSYYGLFQYQYLEELLSYGKGICGKGYVTVFNTIFSTIKKNNAQLEDYYFNFQLGQLHEWAVIMRHCEEGDSVWFKVLEVEPQCYEWPDIEKEADLCFQPHCGLYDDASLASCYLWFNEPNTRPLKEPFENLLFEYIVALMHLGYPEIVSELCEKILNSAERMQISKGCLNYIFVENFFLAYWQPSMRLEQVIEEFDHYVQGMASANVDELWHYFWPTAIFLFSEAEIGSLLQNSSELKSSSEAIDVGREVFENYKKIRK